MSRDEAPDRRAAVDPYVAELEEALAAARRRIRRLEGQRRALRNRRDELVATLLHEIGSPLQAILGHLEPVERAVAPNDQAAGHCESIREAVEATREYATAVAALAGAVPVGATLAPTPTDAAQLISRIAAQMRPLMRPANRLRASITDELRGAPRLLHRAAIRQVAFNLLSNADRHTESGIVMIEAALDPDGDRLLLVVRDTGEGMAPAWTRRVLRPYAQAPSRLRRMGEGSGLGLALCKRLTERLGGSLHIESVLGCGTAVFAAFPSPPATAASCASVRPVATARALARPVLLADDDRVLRGVLADAIAERGLAVVEVRDGLEAWEALRRERFSAAVLDNRMPGMSGTDLAARWGEILVPTTPAILLSVDANDLASACLHTTFLCLRKPVPPGDLADRLLRLIAL